MAILQGISGLAMGDGSSGKIALSIHTRVLQILSNDKLSYLLATITDPSQAASGSISYYVPEIIGSGEYGTAGEGTNFVQPSAGLVSININKTRINKHEIETFDIARLSESNYILSIVASGIARAIQADLNAEFLAFLYNELKPGGSLENQKLVLNNAGKGDPELTPEQSRVDYNRIQLQIARLQKMFDKKMLGVSTNEVFGIISPELEVDIKNAFWNQPNSLGEFIIKETLEGTRLGNFNYFVDIMLNHKIDAGTSFSNKELKTTGLNGIILHKEAVGMPLSINQTSQVINPENGNLRFITKYMFGIGILRPKLIYSIQVKGAEMSNRTKDKDKDKDKDK